MAFAISPADLNVQATTLRDCAASTSTAQSYGSDHLSLEAYEAGVIFQQARTNTHDLRDAISSYLGALNTADTASATELDNAATRSVEIDDATEAELDAAYPDSGVAVSL